MCQNIENQTNKIEGPSLGIQCLRALCALMVFFSHYCKAVNNPYILAFCQNRMSFMVDGASGGDIFCAFGLFLL